MSAKRNEELVNKVENVIADNNVSDETKQVVKDLLNAYKNRTFENWDDRHEFYYEIVDDMVNDCGFDDKGLAKKMANNHPTLQQNFMRLCIHFIKEMANKTYFDGRNKNSVELAKKIVEIDDTYLPYI